MGSGGSLNHVYRTVWNQALGAMVAIAEISTGRRKSASQTGTAAIGSPSGKPRPQRACLASLAIAMAWGAAPTLALAQTNPTGGVAIQGQATFSTNGNNLLVTTQNGAGLNHSAINWQSFSIPSGSTTYFQQPSVSSTSINRVVTSTPSLIFGNLGSNGNLVLVNQSGITVGAGAVVDTAGFTASALRMSDADALSGRLRFGDATSATGAVSVMGNVLARSGDVVLMGSSVDTGVNALVQAPNGSTVLAAGQQIEITGRGLEGIVMQVQAPTDSAVNLGTLKGDAVGIFAGTLKHSGLIQATTATLEGGKVVLKAGGDTYVQDSSQTLVTSASGKGGQIEVLGNRVAVKDNAVLDASGATGGGTVLLGGDYQGKNTDIQNASVTYFGPQASIKADATVAGDGGKVILWADDTTRAYGSIWARGGILGGDGGFVETSGHRYLDVNGIRVNTLAPLGTTGNWLLDPTDITITHGTGLGTFLAGIPAVFDNGGGLSATLTDGAINNQLYLTNISVLTSGVGGASGDLVFDSTGGAIAISNTTTLLATRLLNLNADGKIVFRGANGTTFAGSAQPLTVVVSPASQVVTEASSSVTLDGSSKQVLLRLPAGKSWDNFGTLNLNGDASVQIEQGAVFNNKVGGTTNVTVVASNGFAFTSPSSSPSLDDGIVNNDGTMNVNLGTAFEAEYNQSGTLNINNSALNLQNVNSVTGTVELAALSSQYASILNVTEQHGHTANFHNMAINRTQNILTANGASPQINIGAGFHAVDATFTAVTAPDVVLGVNGLDSSNLASATVLNGASTFYALNTTANGSFAFNNGALGLLSSSNVTLDLSGNTSFTGNVDLYTVGALKVQLPITTTGNVKLISGWNGNMAAPASLATFRQVSTGLTVSSALNANNINLESSDGIALDAALTASGTFDARARSGNIAPTVTAQAQTFSMHLTGASTLNASGYVELVNAGNTFSSLNITAGGSVNVVAASSLSLGNISGTSVTLDATGSISQAGSITTTGTSSIFSSVGGDGGAVNVYGSSLALGAINANGVTTCTDGGCGPGGNGGDVLLHAKSGGFSSGSIFSNGGNGDATLGGNGGHGGTITLVENGGIAALSTGTFHTLGGTGTIGSNVSGVDGTAGKWRVYADTPSSISKGGLTSDFRHYNATYANYQGQSVTETGSGFIYASAAGELKVDTTLTGTASNTYGDTPNAVFGYTLSGFADSEDTASNISLGGAALFDHSFLASTNAGNYVQKYASGLSSTLGYTFAAQNGVAYTVNQRPITLSTSSVTKTYDGTTTAAGTLILSAGSMAGSDALSGGTFAFSNRDAGISNKTVDVSSVTVTDGNAGANYLVTYAANTSSTITKAAVTLNAPVISKTYDGTTAYSTNNGDLAALTGALIAGDSVTAATMAYINKNAGTSNKAVDLTAVTLNDGNGGNNYSVTLGANSISTINKAAFTLAAPVVSKTYDGTTTFAFTANELTTLSNALVAGDLVVAGGLKYADKNAGAANKSVVISNVALNDGNGGGNYNLSFTGNSISTITPAPLATWVGGTSGLWSSASNWTALPDGNNVLAVNIPVGTTVLFDTSAPSTSLQSISSLGTLSIAGGNLSVSNAFNTANYSQTGGTVSGTGSFSVSDSFSQSVGTVSQPAGTIAMGGPVSIRQASGNLSVGNITGSSIALEAVSGAVSQTAPLVTAGLLKVAAANGVSLTDSNNAVSAFSASTTGTGNVALTNGALKQVVALDVQGITVAGGNLVLDNTGALTTSGAIHVPAGNIAITTHSPLTINSTVDASGNITLAALSPDSSSNITLNGAMTSTTGGISVQAYNNFIQNAGLNAALAIDVSAGGVVTFGPGALSVGNPVSYQVNGTPYLPPWVAATLSGGATDFVVTFLDQFQAVLDAQVLAMDDPLGIKQRSKEGLVLEGDICKP
jgi:filamentous hemagglutinin family protein